MRGIYAHKNLLNNKIFYVGQQRVNNNRSHQFKTQRSQRYRDYVDKLGIENIEVIWLYVSHDDNENLFHKESYYQHKYYQNGYLLTTELIQNKELNSNYGNKWTQEQKKHLSKCMTGKMVGTKNPMYHISPQERMGGENSEKYNQWRKSLSSSLSGTKNPRATKCSLYYKNKKIKQFNLLKDLITYMETYVIHQKLNRVDYINNTYKDLPLKKLNDYSFIRE